MELKESVDAVDSRELRNWYVWHFSGLSPEAMDADPDEAIRLALQRVTTRYRVVGFQDDLATAARRLREATGLKGDFSAFNANRSTAADREPVSETARRRITEANALDIQFYQALRDRYAASSEPSAGAKGKSSVAGAVASS